METIPLAQEKDPFERLKEICGKVGLDIEKVRPSILERVKLLAETTETVNDCERAAGFAEEIFDLYEHDKPAEKFSDLEKKIVVIGSIFSDIGKTGPGEALPESQKLIAEMFAVEDVRNPKMTVEEFFGMYFSQDAADRVQRFRDLNLDPHMTMREFWNMHSLWTLQIIQGDGVPEEAVAAAATHHLLENVNPDSIVAEDGRFTQFFGENASFDRPEKLVILLDKYDAARRRGKKSHAEAVEWLKNLIKKNERFEGDLQFLELIGDLDAVCKGSETPGKVGV
jgi:hypothetical protein